MARQAQTLIEHVYARNRSFRDTGKTVTFIMQWAFAMQQLGESEITMKQYVAFWPEDSQAKSYRLFESFRRTFPDHPDPNRIGADLAAQFDEKLTRKNLAADAPLQKIPPAAFA